ncbi:hypothetical protein SLE2022_069900 [Rubroshorea leprosula]
MDERMWEAARAGKVDALYALIQENPFVFESIDEVPFIDTPLHIAASEGHIDFVMEMMMLKPSFARKLNPSGFSPMHLALQNERDLVVHELLKVDKVLVRVKGKGGLTSLHLAAEKGNLNLLAEFLEACPECITDLTIQGQTALHIAAIYNNFESLQLLICWLRKTTHKDGYDWEKQVVNKKDRAGNTVLHIAASNNHSKIVKLLVKCKIIENGTNLNGRTALEMLEGQVDVRETARTLRWAGYLKSEAKNLARQTLAESLRSESSYFEKLQRYLARKNNNISSDMRNTMLVVAALILTASYHACLNPPGGLWPSNFVGSSVLSTVCFAVFYAINSATFLTSTSIVFYLLPDENINLLTLPVLLFILCYLFSIAIISPSRCLLASIPFILLVTIGFGFVLWPKIFELYCRRRPSWSWMLKFLFFLCLLYMIMCMFFGVDIS